MALALAAFTRKQAEAFWVSSGRRAEHTMVYTSTMPRAIASVSYATLWHEQTSALNPIDKGPFGCGWWDVECPGDMPPWQEVAQRHPEFWARLQKDPLRTRFPGGESYFDMVRRLEGLLIEIEQHTRPVLVVSHVTTLQPLLAYFLGKPVSESWQVPVRKNIAYQIAPTLGGGFIVTEHELESARPVGADDDELRCIEKRSRTG